MSSSARWPEVFCQCTATRSGTAPAAAVSRINIGHRKRFALRQLAMEMYGLPTIRPSSLFPCDSTPFATPAVTDLRNSWGDDKGLDGHGDEAYGLAPIAQRAARDPSGLGVAVFVAGVVKRFVKEVGARRTTRRT